jgi:hypothetical protein
LGLQDKANLVCTIQFYPAAAKPAICFYKPWLPLPTHEATAVLLALINWKSKAMAPFLQSFAGRLISDYVQKSFTGSDGFVHRTVFICPVYN